MTQLQKFIATLNLNIKSNNFFFKFSKTKFILKLVKLLIKFNYFIGYKSTKKQITIFFKLNFEQTKPFIISCKQISNSSRPVYIKYNQWPTSGSSLLILSTSRGLMIHKEAWKQKLGGLLLFKIT